MDTIGVIGAGTMGAGIAQVAASHDTKVLLMDATRERTDAAIAGIGKRLDRLVEKGRIDPQDAEAIKQRVAPVTDPAAFAEADFVIEAVLEDIQVKATVFGDVLPHLRDGAFLATNTSSLSVGAIGDAIGAAERTVGMHFFNPVPLMPLVEIISGAATDPAIADRAFDIAKRWGKTVVRAADTPGFIVNRVARGFYLEGLRMLGEGIAPIDAIDRAIKTLGGFRMGPFELMDLVGIDVNYPVSVSVWEQLDKPVRLTPHPIQRDLYESGRLGRKAGSGAYDYSGDTPVPAIAVDPAPLVLDDAMTASLDAFVRGATDVDGDPIARYAFGRVLATIINEAGLALDDGVATAGDIDLAMKKGTNYPRGPLEWANAIGRPAVVAWLDALDRAAGDGRFRAAASLRG